MKKLTLVALAAFTMASCASMKPLPQPTGNPIADINAGAQAVVADVTGTPASSPATPAPVPEAVVVDPLTRILTSPTLADNVQKALAIDPNDQILAQCLNGSLAIGQDLKANPLLTTPTITLQQQFVVADPSCLLCVFAAKRHDLAVIEAGGLATQVAAYNTQVAAIRAHALDIRKKFLIACAPLKDDEVAQFALLVGMLKGLGL